MKKILVFRHVPHEDLGTLRPFLDSRKVLIEYCDLFKHSAVPENPSSYSLVISMGGPMNVDETERYPFLGGERLFLRKAIDSGTSVLGVCLGSQMIARALGARIYKGNQKEIGWFPIQLTDSCLSDPVFGQTKERKPYVFHWHGDTFDIPKGAVRLASSHLYSNQAFRYNRNVYGFQFHIEMTPGMIALWADQNKAELASIALSKDKLMSDTEKHMDSLTQMTEQLYSTLYAHLVGSEG